MITDLGKYNNSWYKPGSLLKRTIWYCVNMVFFKAGIIPVYGLKRFLLRLFGARLGRGVIIKPGVSIKYPWLLTVGENTWIGEQVWIDNLAQVSIGNNVCLSQGALLLCGNHDYTKESFDLSVKPIELEDGVWIGAKALVCPGTICKSHAVLTVQSVASGVLEAYSVYQGNPAVRLKSRLKE